MTIGDSHNIRLRNGVFWSAFERFAVQGIQFVVLVFMARALTPTDYGLVGMLTFFIVLSQIIAEGGLAQAIIRKLDRTDSDLSTAFFVNVATGSLLYLVIFISAPYIAAFYHEPILTDMLRVMGVCVVIQSSLVVHRAVLTSRLDFKTQAKSTFVGAVISGLTGLYMAYHGYGVWSIVALQLTNQITTAIALWIVTDWRPTFSFSVTSFRNLYGFGYKLLVSKEVDNVYNSIVNLVIGKTFSAYALGSYTNARQLGSISSENLTRIANRAIFPRFCNLQGTEQLLTEALTRYLRLSVFVIAPLMLGLAALSEPVTTALIGQQWIYTARLLRILCIYFILFPLNSINYMVLEITGNGNLYFCLQLMNAVIGVSTLAILLPFGLSIVCVGLVASSVISYVINAHKAGNCLKLGLRKQLRAILPILANAVIMASLMFAVQFLCNGVWEQIVTGLLTGLITYVGLSLIFQTRLCKTLLLACR